MEVAGDKLPFPSRYCPIWKCWIPGTKKHLLFQKAEIAAAVNCEYGVLIFSAEYRIISAILSAIIARLRKKRVVFWGHGKSTNLPEKGIRWWLRKLVLKLSIAVLLYGQREYDHYKSIGIEMEKIFVAHNALDTCVSGKLLETISNSQIEKFKSEHGLQNKRVLIFTGRLTISKNIALLLKAVQLLKNDFMNLLLIIIGDGPERSNIESMIDKFRLHEHVILTGSIFEERISAKYYLSSELSVCAGSAGLLINHAFAFGVPVVISNNKWLHGPEAEKVTADKTGGFFSDGDCKSLAETIARYLRDDSLRKDMGRQCQRLIFEECNEQQMAKVFDQAVNYAIQH